MDRCGRDRRPLPPRNRLARVGGSDRGFRAIKEADDFFGSHVNLAARVGGAARGNEILVSGLLKALTESAGEFRFDDGREVELKGISGAQRVHVVEWR